MEQWADFERAERIFARCRAYGAAGFFGRLLLRLRWAFS